MVQADSGARFTRSAVLPRGWPVALEERSEKAVTEYARPEALFGELAVAAWPVGQHGAAEVGLELLAAGGVRRDSRRDGQGRGARATRPGDRPAASRSPATA